MAVRMRRGLKKNTVDFILVLSVSVVFFSDVNSLDP